eukprot:CAMPEP_0195087416 /NCGR_PEP_ID=MMETSP0448-20130528/27261_1 /TAXON_ID=66468 /ORGANISM="Heterocapsa triquestra, Strain CCMP 448" /LENGTH=219 /DNA_ID=CAMNT_0040120977 /DNA_START=89 /DNA_END=745 /DNA_ORIENTATION=-
MAEEQEEFEWLSDYVLAFLKSPTWVSPIAQFVDERCIIFEHVEENKLEYTICHDEFKELIDSLLAAHLLELSIMPEQFQQFCVTGLGGNRSLHRVLVEQLLSVDDFLTFKAMMVRRNTDLFREALKTMDNGESLDDAAVGPSAADPAAASCAAAADLNETRVIEDIADHDAGEGAMLSAEWQFYEDQLFEALRASEDEVAATERQSEEAELEAAIALSL